MDLMAVKDLGLTNDHGADVGHEDEGRHGIGVDIGPKGGQDLMGLTKKLRAVMDLELTMFRYLSFDFTT